MEAPNQSHPRMEWGGGSQGEGGQGCTACWEGDRRNDMTESPGLSAHSSLANVVKSTSCVFIVIVTMKTRSLKNVYSDVHYTQDNPKDSLLLPVSLPFRYGKHTPPGSSRTLACCSLYLSILFSSAEDVPVSSLPLQGRQDHCRYLPKHFLQPPFSSGHRGQFSRLPIPTGG